MESAVHRDSLDEYTQKLTTKYKTLFAPKSAVGAPLVASTVSAMTDTTKVYVYTGSETGYSTGYWYYYNGSAWTSGGVYNSAAVETDTTLSVSGAAADAKAAGDAINTRVQAVDSLLTVTDFDDIDNNIIIPCSVDNRGADIANAPVNDWITGLIITFGRNSERSSGDVQIFIPEGNGAMMYRKYSISGSSDGWSAWVSGSESIMQIIDSDLPQFRSGINDAHEDYNSHIYEYLTEGTFYATQMKTTGTAQVRRWVDLPTQDDSPYIIINSRYGNNWVLQMAIKADTLDAVYIRLEPIVPSENETITTTWTRISCDLSGVQSQITALTARVDNLPQAREGINSVEISTSYNHHIYAYKKDGTFYTTPANWNDLPTTDSPYIITNSRYGSWILQTAVKANTPEIVYSRFISNNPADDNNTQYYWRKRSGVEMLDYWKHSVTNYLSVGLPILFLSGSTSGMSKKNAVELSYKWGDVIGTCSVNWQGSSSVSYPKKNYTINFDSALNVGGWGYHSKFCLKANFIDNSNALNVCGAKLWSQIVTNRGEHPAIAYSAPNKGAMDGFPCIVLLNDEFHGLYTFNIPKDIWAYGMGVSGSGHVLENEYIVTAEDHVSATQFRSIAELDGTDFKLEYSYGTTDEQKAETAAAAKTSLNNMLSTLSGLNSSGWESTANAYIDVNTAMDYMIFSALIANTDGVDKNFILTSYDGTKWWFNAYDLDSIFGNYWTGGKYYAPSGDNDNKTSFAWLASTSKLFNLIWTYNRPALIQRYNELRNGILSEENVYMTFYNFCVEIPQVIIDEDNRKYPEKPGTSTETLSRIMEWYKKRCKVIDYEINGSNLIQTSEISEVLTGS